MKVNKYDASFFREIVQLYKESTVKDEAGGTDVVRSLYKTLYAVVETKSGSRNLDNGQLVYTNIYTFTFRYDVLLDFTDVVLVHRNKEYVIHDVLNKNFINEIYEVNTYASDNNKINR